LPEGAWAFRTPFGADHQRGYGPDARADPTRPTRSAGRAVVRTRARRGPRTRRQLGMGLAGAHSFPRRPGGPAEIRAGRAHRPFYVGGPWGFTDWPRVRRTTGQVRPESLLGQLKAPLSTGVHPAGAPRHRHRRPDREKKKNLLVYYRTDRRAMAARRFRIRLEALGGQGNATINPTGQGRAYLSKIPTATHSSAARKAWHASRRPASLQGPDRRSLGRAWRTSVRRAAPRGRRWPGKRGGVGGGCRIAAPTSGGLHMAHRTGGLWFSFLQSARQSVGGHNRSGHSKRARAPGATS